jgi:hypothetical protein
MDPGRGQDWTIIIRPGVTITMMRCPLGPR